MKILYNARVYTFDGETPSASAIAIDRERILAVGKSDELRGAFQGRAAFFDLDGRTVIPGLVDAHLHLEQYALSLQKLNCESTTKGECLKRVAERAQHLPAGAWILGHGWNQNNWPEGYGTAEELDAAAPKNPVFLTAKSLHAAWVNSQALRLAGIQRETEHPSDGCIGRDERGNPNGTLFESAMALVEQIIPPPSVEDVARAIQSAQSDLWRKGLTGVHDFDRWRCFAALQILHERGELRLRVLKSIPFENLKQAAELGLRSGFGDDFLRMGGVKIFADGALGPHTAAMLQPYEDDADNRGMAFVDGEVLFERGRVAAEAGISLAVHAIGDLANHEVLNGLERLREYERQRSIQPGLLRHRIEHVQLIHPEDAPRLAQLGIVASMQPLHATSDMEMANRYWGKRSAWAYAFNTQLKHGARLVFGSDAPVETPDPFMGVHAAVTRRRVTGEPGERGWYPEQRLNVQQALEAYTLGAAFASGTEDRLGKLAAGFLADLIVLDGDPFKVPQEQLHGLKTLKTMVAGEWTFEA